MRTMGLQLLCGEPEHHHVKETNKVLVSFFVCVCVFAVRTNVDSKKKRNHIDGAPFKVLQFLQLDTTIRTDACVAREHRQ